MLIQEEMEPGPASRIVGCRCDRCGRERMFNNPEHGAELTEMVGRRVGDGTDAFDRQHVCRACREKAGKITGVPENLEGVVKC
jgi:hypothetical protein